MTILSPEEELNKLLHQYDTMEGKISEDALKIIIYLMRSYNISIFKLIEIIKHVYD